MKILVFIATLLLFRIVAANTLSGNVTSFADGDTFTIWNQKIRLVGIDAPESSQSCIDDRDIEYPCGDRAATYLQSLVTGKEIRCEGTTIDAYDRLLATCYIGSININETMVLEYK